MLAQRLEVIIFMRELDLEMQELRADLGVLRQASLELRDSKRLRQLFSLVLACGNVLNDASFRGRAQGISLESLLKVGRLLLTPRKSALADFYPLRLQLGDVRSLKSSTTPTLLHVLARLARRQAGDLLEWDDELPHVELASTRESPRSCHPVMSRQTRLTTFVRSFVREHRDQGAGLVVRTRDGAFCFTDHAGCSRR